MEAVHAHTGTCVECRSMADWVKESVAHGWPSFREGEVRQTIKPSTHLQQGIHNLDSRVRTGYAHLVMHIFPLF
jgi:hypothetical protein